MLVIRLDLLPAFLLLLLLQQLLLMPLLPLLLSLPLPLTMRGPASRIPLLLTLLVLEFPFR